MNYGGKDYSELVTVVATLAKKLGNSPADVAAVTCDFDLAGGREIKQIELVGIKFIVDDNGILHIYRPKKIWTPEMVREHVAEIGYVQKSRDAFQQSGAYPVQPGVPNLWDFARFGKVINVHDYTARYRMRVHEHYWEVIEACAKDFDKQNPAGGFSGNDLGGHVRRFGGKLSPWGDKCKVTKVHTAYMARAIAVHLNIADRMSWSNPWAEDRAEKGKTLDLQPFVQGMIKAKELETP